MPEYRTRPGVVLTCICEEYLLVAASSLRDRVPTVTQLNESSAFLWKQLENGADEEKLRRAVSEEYEIEDAAAAEAAIHAFLDKMLECGYLIAGGKQDE